MSLSCVRNDPSMNVNRGEGELLGKVLYFVSAATGQVEVAVTSSVTKQPLRKGSVFAAFMLMQAAVGVIVTSVLQRVEAGSKE